MDNFAEVYNDIKIKYTTDRDENFVALAINIVNVLPYNILKSLIDNKDSEGTFRLLKYINNIDLDKLNDKLNNETSDHKYLNSKHIDDVTKFMNEFSKKYMEYYESNILYNGNSSDEIYTSCSRWQKMQQVSFDFLEFTRSYTIILVSITTAISAYILKMPAVDTYWQSLPLALVLITGVLVVIMLTIGSITKGTAGGYRDKYKIVTERMDFIYALIKERQNLRELYNNKRDILNINKKNNIINYINNKHPAQAGKFIKFIEGIKNQIIDDDVKLPFIDQGAVKISCYGKDLELEEIEIIDEIFKLSDSELEITPTTSQQVSNISTSVSLTTSRSAPFLSPGSVGDGLRHRDRASTVGANDRPSYRSSENQIITTGNTRDDVRIDMDEVILH